jgi:hypothetical protein
MTLSVGRTIGKFCKVVIGDSANTLRDIPVETINGIGLTYPEVDLTALQDAAKGFLTGQPTAAFTITGPLDTSVAATASTSGAAAVLSGSHTVLQPLDGLMTPRSFAIYIGIREYWTTGQDPVFGISQSATSGFIVTSYVVDAATMKYTAKLALYPGSSLPAWGTSAIS